MNRRDLLINATGASAATLMTGAAQPAGSRHARFADERRHALVLQGMGQWDAGRVRAQLGAQQRHVAVPDGEFMT